MQQYKLSSLTYLLLAIALVAGIWLRFQNVGDKVFWFGETDTVFRIAGFSEKEIYATITAKQIFKPADLLVYQKLRPTTTPLDTIRLCANEADPLNPPLYFILLRLWADLLGSEPAALRLLSVIASIVALPAIYLLSLALFQSRSIAAISVALLAVSPMQILYSQQARSYSMLVCLIFFSANFLLKAVKTQKYWFWVFYTCSIIAGMYLQSLFLLVIVAQAVYVWRLLGSADGRSAIKPFLMSLLFAGCAFAPWAAIMIGRSQTIVSSSQFMTVSISLQDWARTFALNVARTFTGFGRNQFWLYWSTGVLTLVICLFSMRRFIKEAPLPAKTFLICQMLVTTAPLILADLFLGGIRAVIPRYMFPLSLAFLLVVAFAIGDGCRQTETSLRRKWSIALVTLLTLGIFSSYQIVKAKLWWDRAANQNTPVTADLLNRMPKPLLLFSYLPGYDKVFRLIWITSFSYLLKPNVSIECIAGPNAPDLTPGFSDYVVFNPEGDFLANIQRKYRCREIPGSKSGELWRILPNSPLSSHDSHNQD